MIKKTLQKKTIQKEIDSIEPQAAAVLDKFATLNSDERRKLEEIDVQKSLLDKVRDEYHEAENNDESLLQKFEEEESQLEKMKKLYRDVIEPGLDNRREKLLKKLDPIEFEYTKLFKKDLERRECEAEKQNDRLFKDKRYKYVEDTLALFLEKTGYSIVKNSASNVVLEQHYKPDSTITLREAGFKATYRDFEPCDMPNYKRIMSLIAEEIGSFDRPKPEPKVGPKKKPTVATPVFEEPENYPFRINKVGSIGWLGDVPRDSFGVFSGEIDGPGFPLAEFCEKLDVLASDIDPSSIPRKSGCLQPMNLVYQASKN